MKIRIKGNSIRIRLSKTEVQQVCTTGLVEETTNIGNPVFRYRLQRSHEVTELDATFEGGCITVLMPEAQTEGWYENDTVGYQHYKELGNGQQLFLLVEKDFKCIDNEVQEDQSDNYDNPLHSCN